MKRLKKLLIVMGVAALLMLVGCQSSSSVSPLQVQAKDTELMDTFTDEGLFDIALADKSYYVLLVGNDSRLGTLGITSPDYADGSARSDTMMLARIDPVSYTITLITVPRDTACTYQGGLTKINETYRLGGIEQLMTEVEKLTGVMPKYYFDLGFVTFDQFVDAVGGVEVDVPVNTSMSDIVRGGNIVLDSGAQQLNGAEALVFARTRHRYANDLDACRQTQDRSIVEALIKKVAADPANAALNTQMLLETAQTNFPIDELGKAVLDFAAHSDQVKVISGTGPYAGGIEDTTQLWLATRDEATWHQLIEVVNEGGDPKDVLALPQVVAAP